MPLSFFDGIKKKKNKETKNNAPHQVQVFGPSVTEKERRRHTLLTYDQR